MALVLYHNDMSTCAQKVRLTLAEKGLEWEGRHMNLRAGDTRSPEYVRDLHPGGVVPVLVDDSSVIIESTVIMEYLDDLQPTPPLRPADPKARAMMRLWMKKLDVGLHADTGNISASVAFRYQMMEGRSEEELQAFIDTTPDEVKRERQRDIIGNGIDSRRFGPSIRNFDRLFDEMEAALAEGPWLVGKDYSLADIAYTPYLTRFDHLHFLGMLADRPRLADWYERVKARDNYETAMRAWFNPKYLPLMAEKGEEAWPRVQEIIAAGS